MGKLSMYVAMKRDMAFDFEHELRSIRDLILGIHRLSGKDLTIDLSSPDGYVAGTRARAAFNKALLAHMHEILLQYAQDLAREGLELGIHQSVVEEALGGAGLMPHGNAPRSVGEGSHVRLAAVSA